MERKTWLNTILAKNNLHVDPTRIELLARYVELLLEWNKKINLISRRDEENVWTKHIIGSLSILCAVELQRPSSAIDIGTGGGLPGIPLAIALPDVHFTVVDSIQKKILAVKDILISLGLENVTAIAARAEDLATRKEFNGCFDYVLARAVAPMKDLIKWGKPFLRPAGKTESIGSADRSQKVPRGTFIFVKGGDLTAEVNAAKIAVPLRNVSICPIVIDGIEADVLSDKKLVIVQP